MSFLKKLFNKYPEKGQAAEKIVQESKTHIEELDDFFAYVERTFSKDDEATLRNFIKIHSDRLDIELYSGRYTTLDNYIQSMTFEELIHTAIVNYFEFPNRRHYILVKLQRDIALDKIPEILKRVSGFNAKPVHHSNIYYSNMMRMTEMYEKEHVVPSKAVRSDKGTVPSHIKTYEDSKRGMEPENSTYQCDGKTMREILPGTPEHDRIMEDIAEGNLMPTKIHYPDSDMVKPYTGPVELTFNHTNKEELNLHEVTKEFNEKMLATQESEAEKENPRSPGFIDSTVYKESGVFAPVAEYGPDEETKEMKSSGAIQNYVKESFEIIPRPTISAIARTMKEGLEKYGYRNYMGIPKEEHIGRAIRHMYAYLDGDTTEEHLAHAITRLGFAVEMKHIEEQEGRHELFPHLKDVLKKEESSSLTADYIVTNNPRGLTHNIAGDKPQTMFDLNKGQSLEKFRNDSVEKLQGDRV